MAELLSPRWTPLRPHVTQGLFYYGTHRFNVVPAGRRSGKTELAKRRLIKRAIRGTGFPKPRFFYAAPTRDQVKRIAWSDLKDLIPKWARRGEPRESELIIPLWHGGEICCIGMDKPERMEGSPWDGGVLDEYGNMKESAWGQNVRPALSDRLGWCDLIGVPEGRNHYYDRAEEAKASYLRDGATAEWGYFHWFSSDILLPEEIEAAKRTLDELTFQQEYEGSFVNFTGRAYYSFGDANKANLRRRYDVDQPLIVCLDFNVAPGVAAICQEMVLPNKQRGTAVIGEVYIPGNSNTQAVCRKVLHEWGPHRGRVEVYGDATGGARGSAQLEGSDWELVRKFLRKGVEEYRGFGEKVFFFVKDQNPTERARVNALNSRVKAADGTRRLQVDPTHAPHVIRDLEGVRLLVGGSGEIDKKHDKKLTHISDALGYYVDYRFPVTDPLWTKVHPGY